MSRIPEKTRVDKWLWAMRLFKSRSLAAEACDKGKIKIGNQPVKASRNIKVGDIISMRRGPFTLKFEVLKISEARMPAKLVAEYCKDITPADEMKRIQVNALQKSAYSTKGEGRPTKKDRRELDDFKSSQ